MNATKKALFFLKSLQSCQQEPHATNNLVSGTTQKRSWVEDIKVFNETGHKRAGSAIRQESLQLVMTRNGLQMGQDRKVFSWRGQERTCWWDRTGKSSVGEDKKGLVGGTGLKSLQLVRTRKDLLVGQDRKVFSWWGQERTCWWDRTGKSSVGEDKKGLVGGTGLKSLQLVRTRKDLLVGQDRKVFSWWGQERTCWWDRTGKSSVGEDKKGLVGGTGQKSLQLVRTRKDLLVGQDRKVFSWRGQERTCLWDRTEKSSVGEDKQGLVGGTGQKSLQMLRQEKIWMGQDRSLQWNRARQTKNWF